MSEERQCLNLSGPHCVCGHSMYAHARESDDCYGSGSCLCECFTEPDAPSPQVEEHKVKDGSNRYKLPFKYKRINANESNEDCEYSLTGPNAKECDDENADSDYLLNFGYAQGAASQQAALDAEREKVKRLLEAVRGALETDICLCHRHPDGELCPKCNAIKTMREIAALTEVGE